MGNENKKFKILIVDDNPKNIQLAANILQKEGYQMAFAQSGESALSQAQSNRFDLILLDVMMPGMDGFAVCEQLRKNYANKDIPLIFLTAKNLSESIIRGFEVGAMDYVTKPFSPVELLARLRSITRRTQALDKSSDYLIKPFIKGKLRVDFSSGEVSIEGRPVKINPWEYDLMKLFVTNPGVEYTNEELMEKFESQYEQEDSQKIYDKRKARAELPFGHMKRNLKTDAFLMRGLDGVNAETSLVATCFNIARMITIMDVSGILQKLPANT